ncbi:MAG TPA: hypothetical protein VGE07_05340 [Herpetosiphonaceae bacterium]
MDETPRQDDQPAEPHYKVPAARPPLLSLGVALALVAVSGLGPPLCYFLLALLS